MFGARRWMTEVGKRTGAWMPFGQGVRMCLGYQTALTEMKVRHPPVPAMLPCALP